MQADENRSESDEMQSGVAATPVSWLQQQRPHGSINHKHPNPMRYIRFIFATLASGLALALPPCARAQIGYFDGPSPINYNANSLNAATFTVSPGAQVLVVLIGDRNQGGNGSDPGAPSSVTWNGHALTLAVAANTGVSTYDDNSIYYLVNPPAGTGSVSATWTMGSVPQTWWMAYTLTNVNTSVAPLTGQAGSGSSVWSWTNTVAGAPYGGWAAVNASCSGGGQTLIAASGGTMETTTLNTSGNAGMVMGGVANIPSGNNQFILTNTTTATAKLAMAEAIFSPVAPGTPTWVSVTSSAAGVPAQVNLSWTSSGAASYILRRSTNSTGAYTDFTNLLSGSTTSYQDTRVIGGTEYYYMVSAANGVATNNSVQTNATPLGGPFPPVLGAGPSGARSITLRWLAPVFGATNYIVKRATTSGAEAQIATTTNTTYVDPGLISGMRYFYTVTAVGPGGQSSASNEASAVAMNNNWHLFDNLSLDNTNAPLNGQTGSAGLGLGWTNLGGGVPVIITNDIVSFSNANFGQYASGAPANIGDYEAGLGIPGNGSASTVFLMFSLPGIQPTAGNLPQGDQTVAMNFEIDNASPPTAMVGTSINGPSAQFNYDNFNGGGVFRVWNGGTPNYVTISPSSVPYVPIPGNVYYFWFQINAAKGTYQVYLADASMTGTNLDAGGLGTAPTLMWGTTSLTGNGSIYTFGFRNIAAGASAGQPVNYIATGPGTPCGTVPQNEFANIYVDPTSNNLTNPVTGAAPTGAIVLQQPLPAQVFAGFNASFTCVGSPGVTYQWYQNGTALTDGGRIMGSTTSTLTISNVTAGDATSYNCIIRSADGSAFATSAAMPLTIVAPSGAYETALVASSPGHYYAFDDTGDPSTGAEVALDYAACDDGIYGANAQNGFNAIPGPRPATWPGFSSGNHAAAFNSYYEPAGVTVASPWNLNTNTVTLSAWIYPTSYQQPGAAIVVCSGLGTGFGNVVDVEGLNFAQNGSSDLAYTWNNDTNTMDWDSGLQPPLNEWSFVSLVVTPTNATIYMMNTNGPVHSTFVYPHAVARFANATMIGDDPGYVVDGSRIFNGSIDSVAVYGQALSEGALLQMFTNASGVSSYPPFNSVAPGYQAPYPGQTAQFSSQIGGTPPFTNTWQIGAVNLTDGPNSIGTVLGSATASLTVSNLATAAAGNTYYLTLVTRNSAGSYTSSVPAELYVQVPNPPGIITTTGQEPLGSDWNTGSSWSDGNPASLSAYSAPGSTYEILPGHLERSPVTTNNTFPGAVLIVEGDGNLVDADSTNFVTQTTIGELRFKEYGTTTNDYFGTVFHTGCSVTFPDLQLNGGQVINGEWSVIEINGRIDVLANSVFYVDSLAGYNQSMQINAFLTGAGTLTWAYLSSAYPYNALVIAGTSNTFSGQWNVVQGTLVGNAPNSLGTNSITVQPTGALETTYDLLSPKASLTLNGQMYLYKNDTFHDVTINGTAMSPGTYSFAQLNSAYPANFPATWPVQLGSSTGTNAGVGSLTVLTGPQPPPPASIGNISFSGSGPSLQLTLTGTGGKPSGTYHVVTTTNVAAALSTWSVVTNGTFDASGNFTAPFPASAASAQQFYSVVQP